MRQVNKEKQFFKEMLNDLLPMADDDMARYNMGLEPGTYTAMTIIKKVGVGYETSASYRIVQNELGTFKLPVGNVFKQIKYCEKYGGITGDRVHKWTIKDTRVVVGCSIVTFSSKKEMKALSRIMRTREKAYEQIAIFSLRDGCIRSIRNGCSSSKTMIFPFKLSGERYEVLHDYRHLSFKIDAEKLEHLYGDCKITIHKNQAGDITSTLNPYNIRIVIENSDGWSVSSNEIVPLCEEYIDLYDAHFWSGYENDSLPKLVSEMPGKRNDSGDNSINSIPCKSGDSVSPNLQHEHKDCQSLKSDNVLEHEVKIEKGDPNSSNRIDNSRKPDNEQPIMIEVEKNSPINSTRVFHHKDTPRANPYISLRLHNRQVKKYGERGKSISLCRKNYIEHSVKKLLNSRPRNV